MAEVFAADYEDLTGKAMTVEVGTVDDTAEGERTGGFGSTGK